MNKSTSESRQIHHDVKHCSSDELRDLYGIEINADGTILDITYNTTHATVDDWIDSSETEDYEGFEKFSKYDDDFY